MHDYYALNPPGRQAAPEIADHLRQQLHTFLASLLAHLDAKIDRRLVRTFLTAIEVLLQFRHRAHGLLLSELGAWIAAAALWAAAFRDFLANGAASAD